MRALGYPAEQTFEISKRVHGDDPARLDAVREVAVIAEGSTWRTSGGRALLMERCEAFDGLCETAVDPRRWLRPLGAPLGNYLPVEQTTMGRTIVQFDKDDLDMIGVPKFDFLGLGALSMVRIAFDAIERTPASGRRCTRSRWTDAKTYDLIQTGETIGTFQIESRAQINSILHTKPDHLYDIVVQVALIRPGPIQANVRSSVHRAAARQGAGDVSRIPISRRCSPRTQGIPIFQEQAMAIAMKLGGYTGDAGRRAAPHDGQHSQEGPTRSGARRLEEGDAARATSGAIAPLSEERRRSICDDLVSFANYGFPESHAWSFALIAYVTSYLKAHYPTEFFIGLLNAQPMGFYPVSTLVHDAKRHGVEVRPPCLRRGG